MKYLLSMIRCLNGKRSLAGGYGWRFSDKLIPIPTRKQASVNSQHVTHTTDTAMNHQPQYSQVLKKRKILLDPKEAAIPCDDDDDDDDDEQLDDDDEVEGQASPYVHLADRSASTGFAVVAPLSPSLTPYPRPSASTPSLQEKRLIEQVDIKTNKVVRRYANATEATMAMQIPNKLSDVLGGRRLSTYGYCWRYID
jgi:hypothetical protein